MDAKLYFLFALVACNADYVPPAISFYGFALIIFFTVVWLPGLNTFLFPVKYLNYLLNLRNCEYM